MFTLKYTVLTTIILLALGLGLALLVQESTRWKGVLRTSFLVPSALGLASASLLFYVLYSPIAGPFADLMADAGASRSSARPTARCGRRSSSSCGATRASTCCSCWWACRASPTTSTRRPASTAPSRWQTFRSVTIPLLRPTLALTTVLCVTGSLLAFEQFYILTKGGPDNSTITIVQLIYNVAFQGQNDLGVAAALSVIVLLALVVINVVADPRVPRTDED